MAKVVRGGFESVRVVSKLPEPHVARLAEDTADLPGTVIVVDRVRPSDLGGSSSADRALRIGGENRRNGRDRLLRDSGLPTTSADDLKANRVGMFSFPAPSRGFARLDRLREVVRSGGSRLTLSTVRSRFRVRSRPDPESGDWKLSTTQGACMNLAYLVAARSAKFGDLALWESALRTRFVTVMHGYSVTRTSGIGPDCATRE